MNMTVDDDNDPISFEPLANDSRFIVEPGNLDTPSIASSTIGVTAKFFDCDFGGSICDTMKKAHQLAVVTQRSVSVEFTNCRFNVGRSTGTDTGHLALPAPKPHIIDAKPSEPSWQVPRSALERPRSSAPISHVSSGIYHGSDSYGSRSRRWD